ncbi:phytoene desaturase family protein [Nocardioides immobilis]|uniref:phytoene desaturase family protein n=1 Tax=Nocardioides immobilis TaxID=2049295 RepID=UPI001C70E11D|nr:FAD-dependent oxidoreductase [Nocardioides immobilis]
MPSAAAYVLGFAGVHRGPGVLRPRGGMSGVARAMQGVLEEHGGELRLSSPVAEIVVADGRAVGVRLQDGTMLRARHGVLSNLAPQVTFGPLLAPEHLTRAEHNRVAMVPSNSINVAAFKIDVAVGGRVGFPAAERRRARRDDADVRKATLMTGTLEDHVARCGSA